MAYYLLPRGLPKTIYAGTLIAVFAVSNTVKLGLYVWLNADKPHIFLMALALMPALPIGVWCGKRLHDRLNERTLYTALYLLLAAAGINLLITSLVKLAA
jgi:hypothetical protein